MFFGGNFEHSRNGGMIFSQYMPNGIGNMLIDENDANVFANGKSEKGLFEEALRGLRRDDEKVAARGGAVTNAGEQKARHRVLVPNDGHQFTDFLMNRETRV